MPKINLQKVVFPSAIWANIPDQERYTFLLLGHISNELRCVQNLLTFSLPKDDELEIHVREAKLGTSLFLWRIALGKILEADDKLRNIPISPILATTFFPVVTNGLQRWKDFRKQKESLKWLHRVRNQAAFHYPDFQDCKEAISELASVDFVTYSGDHAVNNFFSTSDQFIQMVNFVSTDKPVDVDEWHSMIAQLIDLLVTLADLIDDLVGEYAISKLTSNLQVTPLENYEGPSFSEFQIPAFFDMKSKAD